jgi:hypothetical protein
MILRLLLVATYLLFLALPASVAQGEFFYIDLLQFSPRALIIPSNETKITGAIEIFSKYPLKNGTVTFTSINSGAVGCSTVIRLRTSGDALYGKYLLSCDFSSDTFNAYGDNYISVWLVDREGNSITFDQEDIQEFQLQNAYLTISAIEVLDTPEYDPPIIEELVLSASKFYVDLSTGKIDPPVLTATLRAIDAVSIAGISISISKEGSAAPIACAGLVFYYSQNFIDGNYTNGVYQASCTMFIGASTLSPIGNYTFFIVASDLLGNSREFTAEQLDEMGLPSGIEYISV